MVSRDVTFDESSPVVYNSELESSRLNLELVTGKVGNEQAVRLESKNEKEADDVESDTEQNLNESLDDNALSPET